MKPELAYYAYTTENWSRSGRRGHNLHVEVPSINSCNPRKSWVAAMVKASYSVLEEPLSVGEDHTKLNGSVA